MKTGFKLVLLPLLSICLLGKPACQEIVHADGETAVKNALQQARREGVNEAILDRLQDAVRRRKIEPANQVRWLAYVCEAARQGLPLEPLADKIEEGIAKQVPGDRIDSAVRRILKNLSFSADLIHRDLLLKPVSNDPPVDYGREIVRMSELLSAGLEKKEIIELFREWSITPLRQKVEAVSFYAVAKQVGLKSTTARQIAAAGLQHGHFHGFPLELAMMIKAAQFYHIPEQRIAQEALKVVCGRQTVLETHRLLGIRPMCDISSQGRRPAGVGQRGAPIARDNGFSSASGGKSVDGERGFGIGPTGAGPGDGGQESENGGGNGDGAGGGGNGGGR